MPSGIEPMTLWLIVQCLNQLCYHVAPLVYMCVRVKNVSVLL
jgi:hypothetical protein